MSSVSELTRGTAIPASYFLFSLAAVWAVRYSLAQAINKCLGLKDSRFNDGAVDHMQGA